MYVSFVGRVSQSALPSFLMTSDFKKRMRKALAERDYGGGVSGLVITVDSLDPESGLTAVPRKARKQRNANIRNEMGALVTLPNLYEAGIVIDERELSICRDERQVVKVLVDSISSQADFVLGNLKGFNVKVFVQDLYSLM